MLCHTKKPCGFFVVAIILAVLITHLTPVAMLADKPANSEPAYTSGWKDGCNSGINANSPLSAMFLSKPFINQGATAEAVYKNGWNEGFTVCRFAQDSVDKWVQILLIVAALLFVFRSKYDQSCEPK